jgi:hypothetical protein
MFKREFTPSDYFCALCGRTTNDKRLVGDILKNQFFICHKDKKIWCGSCLSQLIKMPQSKMWNYGKKGRLLCPECGENLLMAKNPINIPFTQDLTSSSDDLEAELYGKTAQISGKMKICPVCGKEIREEATFCDSCGAKQE